MRNRLLVEHDTAGEQPLRQVVPLDQRKQTVPRRSFARGIASKRDLQLGHACASTYLIASALGGEPTPPGMLSGADVSMNS